MSQQKVERSQERSQTLERLIKYLHYRLNHDQEALTYLKKERRLQNETIVKFQLGAFPPIPTLIREFSEFELMLIGVLRRDDSGNLSSKFTTNRLIIPIFDLHGRAVAVIGRVLCSEEERAKLGVPKYDNTIFSKSKCLFGLNLAKNSIRETGAALVVEGNFDVISAVQAGVPNVVASSGAFFTQNQIALLSRYCERISLGLDRDEAGERAMKKILSRPAPDGVLIKQIAIPGAFKDWDEYFRSKCA